MSEKPYRGEERRAITWQEEIARLDRGQAEIMQRLDVQDANRAEDRTTLQMLVESQAEQTQILTTIKDYFTFGRVGKQILISSVAIGAAVVWLISSWKGFLEGLKAFLK